MTRSQKKGGYGIKKTKCRTKKCRDRKKKQSRKNVKKGFSKNEKRELIAKGFTNENIKYLESLGMNIVLINLSLNSINKNTGANWTAAELIDDLQGLLSDQSNELQSNNNMYEPNYLQSNNNMYEPNYLQSNNNMYEPNYYSMSDSIGSLHLSDLGENSPTTVTANF
jgi:hypothetical protein